MIRTLRKGLPRFVVFIMCDEDADGASAGGGMTDYGEEIKKERRKEELKCGDGDGGQARRWMAGRRESGEKMRTNDDKRRGRRLCQTR